MHDPREPWTTPVARCALALGLAVLGASSVANADFAFQWQPVPADVPARATLATAAGLVEILAGVLLVVPRTRAAGAWLAAAVLVGWTALHLPAVVANPKSMADWLGLAESAAMASALVMFAADSMVNATTAAVRRWGMAVFGLSVVVFGLSHFAYADFTASMIPAWLPQRMTLAYATGAAHALAGLAITVGAVRGLAAALESLMMAGFVVLVHVPRVAASPGSRLEWTMLLVAVMLSSSAALVAAIARRRDARA